MSQVSIEYCGRCGLTTKAATARQLILREMGDVLTPEAVTIRPREGLPQFRVSVNGEEVLSVPEGDHVDSLAALNAVRYRLGR
jgi:predicted Rdx family selenoprotein